ncbi:Cupredoxin [Elaphomyces granulatus]|jgi:FtsP/CotA-like multicopper oxidase with cupredoxin domain
MKLGRAFNYATAGLGIASGTRQCGNTPSTRSTWCDYSIDTDYYSVVPDTGVTREYYLQITNAEIAPDGYSRPAMVINGSMPGPTLMADWGDTVVVHVANDLTSSTNGTSIHFHGIRQNYTNPNDGVVSITQCPTPPGDSITYKWRATQYGTTWYHSHFGIQTWEGVFGGIVINGPATANYDEDKGIIFLSDWSHQTSNQLFVSTAEVTGPPTLDNGLINGTNTYTSSSNVTTGYRFNTPFTAGTSYRLRLVNTAIDSFFKFSIDNHTLTVIANDLVPIKPYETTVLGIGIAQRYDVIVKADQASVASNFWMRAIPQSACSANNNTDNIKGIVYYGDSPSTPTTTGYSYTNDCNDEDASDLVPYLSNTVSSAYYNTLQNVSVAYNSDNLFRWYLNNSTMIVEPSNPTLLQVYNNDTSFSSTSNVFMLPENQWTYVVIETSDNVTHPIHLHGHDFYVLAQGNGTYDSSDISSLTNPPRRDTAMLPATGYLVVAFQSNNPGAWLMHCHIGWHVSEGLALQFVEQYSKISSLIDYSTLNSTCSAWSAYRAQNPVSDNTSGI